ELKASSLPRHAALAVPTGACPGKAAGECAHTVMGEMLWQRRRSSSVRSRGETCSVRVTQQENLHEWAIWPSFPSRPSV
ncbi:Hypothetical protein SMAX5B_009020, partial [Scophthalmus maximus]